MSACQMFSMHIASISCEFGEIGALFNKYSSVLPLELASRVLLCGARCARYSLRNSGFARRPSRPFGLQGDGLTGLSSPGGEGRLICCYGNHTPA